LSRPKQQEAETAQHVIQQLNFDEDQSNSVSRRQSTSPNIPLVDDWMRRQRQPNLPKVPVASYDWIDRYASGWSETWCRKQFTFVDEDGPPVIFRKVLRVLWQQPPRILWRISALDYNCKIGLPGMTDWYQESSGMVHPWRRARWRHRHCRSHPYRP
jgi:hypothetical protein